MKRSTSTSYDAFALDEKLADDMTHTALTPLLGREFDDFLYAPIGEDRNGTTLSVLSALARLDVDPWQETASLASMPRERATERMTAIIAAVRKDLATSLAAETIAARLIALLPQAATFSVAAPAALLKTGPLRSWRFSLPLVVIVVLLAIYLVVAAHPSFGAASPRPSRQSRPPRRAESRARQGQGCRRPAIRLACAPRLSRSETSFPSSTSLQTSAAQRLTASLSAASAWAPRRAGARASRGGRSAASLWVLVKITSKQTGYNSQF